MSIKLMSLIWSNRSDLLNSTETSVLLRMADFGADDGSSIYPGITRISNDCKLARSTVISTLNSLKAKGFLSVIREAVKETHQSTVYKINVELLNELSVDKKKVSPPPSPVIGLGASPTVGLGASPVIGPQPSLRSTIKNHQPIDRPSVDPVVDDFEVFWKAYPKHRRVAKKACRLVFDKVIKKTNLNILLKALQAQTEERAIKESKGVFVPDWKQPNFWLSGERWNDEIQTTESIIEKAPMKPLERRQGFAVQNIPSVDETRARLDREEKAHFEINRQRENRGPMDFRALLKGVKMAKEAVHGIVK